jgi:alkylation response protein AidB-like acyl-CoA dehydrogenase
MPISIDDRILVGEERDLIALVQEIAEKELVPRASEHEASGTFPESVYRLLGESGLLALPFASEDGGAGVSYTAYLQALEELSTAWLSVGMGVSVHTLAASPIAQHGTPQQKERWLPLMLSGATLGAYCLSEPEAGSDAGNLSTKATARDGGWQVNGQKAWITHGSVADFFALFARTGGEGPRGISLFMTKPSPTIVVSPPERKMGLWASPTVQLTFEKHEIADEDLVGELHGGFGLAMRALDAGRLGIAACAVGHAQHALDLAVSYARERRQFGKSLMEFQGLRWTLAEMQANIISARATYIDAARRKDANMPYTAHASAAKLLATDTAMRAVTDTVQVLGGNGYVTDYDAERLFRETKVLQILEGTNQIQREILGKHLS